MPPTICVPCGRFFKVKRNGVAFQEGFGDGQRRPYKLWVGDLYECEGCHAQIVAGVGQGPVAVQHEARFAQEVAIFAPRLVAFVDDCQGIYRDREKGGNP